MDAYTLHDRAVLAALDTLRINADTARRANPEGSEEYKFFSREHQAACKAEFWFRAGLRAQRAGSRWYVPSSARDGRLYEVVDGRCTCKAGDHGHACWHLLLTTATDMAGDYVDLVDDTPAHDDADAARAADLRDWFDAA